MRSSDSAASSWRLRLMRVRNSSTASASSSPSAGSSASGRSSTSSIAYRSSPSGRSIPGIFTYPPSGISPIRYSVSPHFLPTSIGGKPIVKFNARMPTSLAAPKWPSSWMKIRSSRPRIAMAKLTLPPPPVPWPVRERARCTPAPVRARSAAPSRSDPGFVRPHPGYRQNRCPPRGSLQPRSHSRHSGCRAQCHRPRPASRASRRHRKASRSGGSKSRLNAAPRSSRAAGVAARAG